MTKVRIDCMLRLINACTQEDISPLIAVLTHARTIADLEYTVLEDGKEIASGIARTFVSVDEGMLDKHSMLTDEYKLSRNGCWIIKIGQMVLNNKVG